MCEWLKQSVLKTDVRETVPGVRIPLPPPRSLACVLADLTSHPPCGGFESNRLIATVDLRLARHSVRMAIKRTRCHIRAALDPRNDRTTLVLAKKGILECLVSLLRHVQNLGEFGFAVQIIQQWVFVNIRIAEETGFNAHSQHP